VFFKAEDTKTSEPRVVFLCDQAYDIIYVAEGSDPWIVTKSSLIGNNPSRRLLPMGAGVWE
jgi:hypothetical protein